MKHHILTSLLIGISATGASAQERQLQFSGISSDTVADQSAEIECERVGSVKICELVRRSFGGITLNDTMVLTNKISDRVTLLHLDFDKFFYAKALEVLSAKYGTPDSLEEEEKINETGGPYVLKIAKWSSFSDGDTLALVSHEKGAYVAIRFIKNIPPKEGPDVDF